MGIDSRAPGPWDSAYDVLASANADSSPAPSCMKWGSDGELSTVDLQGILERLGAVDHQASRLMDCPLDG